MTIQLSNNIIYLNHAAVSPWPVETAVAVKRFADENASSGSKNYRKWLHVEQELRIKAANLINAPSPSDIAILKSTSEAISMVAHGLEWRPGENIVTFAGEFPSNRIAWDSLRPQGVELRLAAFDGKDPEAALFALCDGNTRLIAISSVQFANGFRADLERIGSFCRERGILFSIDAIQSLGAIPFDAQGCHADFVMADGHKWMMGPEGVALFYCRPEVRESLTLHQFGWHMVKHRGDYQRLEWEPAVDATRFECGSPNMLGIHALHASLVFLDTIGQEAIWYSIQQNTSRMIEHIQANKALILLSDPVIERRSGIITFRHHRLNPDKIFNYLTSKGVQCAARGNGIRFAPHFYNTDQEIDYVFDLVEKMKI